MAKYFEFTGTISQGRFFEKEAYFVIVGENEEHRLFKAGNRTVGQALHNESDIERHIRYDLDMDTNLVFTVSEFSQHIVSWRWQVMRQRSELVRYIVDQARVSEYHDGGVQDATVWMQKLQPIVAFEIDEQVIQEVETALIEHPDVIEVTRNGGWFNIKTKFY